MTISGVTIQRMAGGRVTEAWTNWDTLGLPAADRRVPAPGGIAEKIGVQVQRAATLVEKKLRSR